VFSALRGRVGRFVAKLEHGEWPLISDDAWLMIPTDEHPIVRPLTIGVAPYGGSNRLPAGSRVPAPPPVSTIVDS
jgi:hypothetical protein